MSAGQGLQVYESIPNPKACSLTIIFPRNLQTYCCCTRSGTYTSLGAGPGSGAQDVGFGFLVYGVFGSVFSGSLGGLGFDIKDLGYCWWIGR